MTTNTNTNTNNTNKANKPRQFYALDWNPSNAYRYTDDAIREWGYLIADIVSFDSKAERDDYVDGEPYIEPISARRAYRINPLLRPSFRRRKRW